MSAIDSRFILGIDTFDLADIYGDYQCEPMFGAALRASPGPRSGIRLICKCGDTCSPRISPVLGTGKLQRIRTWVEAQNSVLDRQLRFELLEAAAGQEVF